MALQYGIGITIPVVSSIAWVGLYCSPGNIRTQCRPVPKTKLNLSPNTTGFQSVAFHMSLIWPHCRTFNIPMLKKLHSKGAWDYKFAIMRRLEMTCKKIGTSTATCKRKRVIVASISIWCTIMKLFVSS
ncbi:hypothetical protein TNCT_247621 [Trichonephila clavata]|uniref:Uncharacterized protein n=1 Tax=Trichonephila clavata TaxID=2740835 RepID=A0A8X6HYY9_TRICU|nr:hypothetical protein TNCT_247621 [Trichonephila clavata]